MRDDNEGIACTPLPPDGLGETVIYKVGGASDYHVNSPHEPDSDYSSMLSGVAPACQDCRGTSMRRGSQPESTDWKFHGLDLKGTSEAQGKRRKADGDNGFEPSVTRSGK